jgi:SAM-dependent methyltransferase
MSEPGSPFSYDAIAAQYAAKVDSAPFNALYERPAMLSLLLPVEGLRILDAGCGSGWYAEQLLERGAFVDAIDGSAEMVSHARRRLSRFPADRLSVAVANLERPLPFGDQRFDGALSPLVLHYLRDWRPALREIHRCLKPGGWLQLSTHNPPADASLFATKKYFEVEQVTDHWDWVGDVTFFRRSLTEIFSSLSDASFSVEKVLEPSPGEEFREADAKAYARLMNQPAFLIIVARKS